MAAVELGELNATVEGKFGKADVRICPCPSRVGDKKVKRFHFSEIIGRLPYMRATITAPYRQKNRLLASIRVAKTDSQIDNKQTSYKKHL